MEKKVAFIAQTANNAKNKINGRELVDLLNQNGFLTNNQQPFKYGRGVYSLINATYNNIFFQAEKVKKGSGEAKASIIAKVFVDSKGLPAWRFKPDAS